MNTRICAALLAASAFGLSGCMGDDYGYGSYSLGYSSGYYGYPYWGWYDDFYYPGTGYYIYDRGGYRHRWSDRQRRYWEGRRGDRTGGDNWSGYRSGRSTGDSNWQQRQQSDRGLTDEGRQQRREAWRGQRQPQSQELYLDGTSREQRREGGRGRGEGRRNRGD